MKKLLLFVFFLISVITPINSQNFTWVRGDNFSGAGTGTYGVMGVPSTTNNPGHRHGSGLWTDASGNLWLYGGEGFSTSSSTSWLSDLWKYSPSTNEWTWVRGSSGPNASPVYGTQNVPASTNEPGAREFPTCWTDNAGNFWMFGGANNAGSGWLGDLWKYNPTTNQWTWVKGFNTVDNNGVYGTINTTSSTNLPGCRTAAAHWVDGNGDLWMFGGRGFAATGGSGLLNDLWKYSITGNSWTWISGTSLSQQNGVYGALSVPSVTYNPGGTEFPACWTDAQGRFYLLTGRGFVGSGTPGYTNDMWRYNNITNEWTWLKGPNLVNQNSVYGQLGVASNSTQPGGRYATAYWKDGMGDFWLFGGLGWAGVSTPSLGAINDMYKYNPTTNQWTRMKGSTSPYTNGTYGTMSIATPANMPGARYFNNFWTTGNNTLWLLGGEGYDASSTGIDNMNDLWKFGVPCNPDSVNASPGTLCDGNSATLTANNQFPASVLWYSSPTSSNSIGSGSAISTGTLGAVGNPSLYVYYAQANACTLTPRTAYTITVNPTPTLSANASASVCSGSSVIIIATGATTYSWVNGANSATNIANPTIATIYTVNGSNSFGCVGSKTIGVGVIPGPTLSISGGTAVCKGASLTLNANGALTYTWANGPASSSFVISPTVNTVYTASGTNSAGCVGSASVNMVVNALPIIAIASKTNACKNEPILLTASGGITYTWTSPSANTATISINTGSTLGLIFFTVSGTGTNGCTNTSVQTISVNTCNYLSVGKIEEIDHKSIQLFPNPNNGQFKIEFESALKPSQLQVVNLLGEVLYSEEVEGTKSSLNLPLAKGVYFVRISREGKNLGTAKFIVE